MTRHVSKSVPDAGRLAVLVADWFLANPRDLPWRRSLDPYAIWVSEIMLQQTQVRTVIPYWERWMKRLPTIGRLARAREATILKLWEGLGYYTRVRNLQKAARVIVTEHQGRFPRAPDDIRALSGIGRYTSGAIASIAFDLPEPILDGNVVRVLSRVFAVAGNPKDKAVSERLWELAENAVAAMPAGVSIVRTDPLVFAGRRSALNQGLMELGATVCLPAGPACEACPLNATCLAFLTGRTGGFPQIPKRARATARVFHTFVLRREDRYLIRQRPAGQVNAGFWEFPGIELHGVDERAGESFVRLFGRSAPELEGVGELRHSITRYRYRQVVFEGEWPADSAPRLADCDWVSPADLRRRPFYSPQRRLLDRL